MTITEAVPRTRPPDRRAQRAWLAGFWVSSVAGVALSVAEATSRPILGARWTLLDVLAAWAGVWVVGVVCALHLPMRRRRAVMAIAVVAVALRLGALASGPTLSDDLYRYSWDARVQLSGVDPYRYPPQAKELRALRESWLWPDAAGCAHIERPPGCTRINRPSDRTIYPPVAEGWFAAVYRVGGGIDSRAKLWQGTGLATELATMGVLTAVLLRRRRDPRWLALYGLCPAPVIEVINDGHVDGLAILFLIAAFLALSPRRGPPTPQTDPTPSERLLPPVPSTGRAAVAGTLIGASALVKLYPIVALLAVWVAPGIRWRHRLASATAAVGLIAVGYAPHVAAVGIKVLGYLPGYLREEHYTGTSSRFLLPALFHLHGRAAEEAVVAAVAATAVVLIVRRPPAVQAVTILIGVLLLAATPVQPWYAVTLVALATMARKPWWGLVAAAGYPYFFAVILSAVHQTGIGQIAYGAAATGVVAISAAGAMSRRR
ncbi:MAG: DUF2029 domain-containing protein, partial [Actinomycetota bacterium]|nr:DUF2029 domain-containing protein [Actinomycetota bacterium]